MDVHPQNMVLLGDPQPHPVANMAMAMGNPYQWKSHRCQNVGVYLMSGNPLAMFDYHRGDKDIHCWAKQIPSVRGPIIIIK